MQPCSRRSHAEDRPLLAALLLHLLALGPRLRLLARLAENDPDDVSALDALEALAVKYFSDVANQGIANPAYDPDLH